MSCDYGVWNTRSRLSPKEAGELHLRLCEGDTSEVTPHPGIEAFYREITSLHPEIDDVPEEKVGDTTFCPWSAGFDRSDGHIIMCCVWSEADYVGDLVSRLARKHGLAFYDPQSERIVYPYTEPATRPWWKIW
jgi:hypothetical protein